MDRPFRCRGCFLLLYTALILLAFAPWTCLAYLALPPLLALPLPDPVVGFYAAVHVAGLALLFLQVQWGRMLGRRFNFG